MITCFGEKRNRSVCPGDVGRVLECCVQNEGDTPYEYTAAFA
jgi:hypothetical protein